MAAVTAAGEWCPKLYDVEMLLELARLRADPAGQPTPRRWTRKSTRSTAINLRMGIPPQGKALVTSEPEHT